LEIMCSWCCRIFFWSKVKELWRRYCCIGYGYFLFSWIVE
jgi:hypothetical protein